MEKKTISLHEIKLFRALVETDRWITSRELAKKAAIGERTARHHLKRFVETGLCDIAEVYPGFRYRLLNKAPKRGGAYLERLQNAMQVFSPNSLE